MNAYLAQWWSRFAVDAGCTTPPFSIISDNRRVHDDSDKASIEIKSRGMVIINQPAVRYDKHILAAFQCSSDPQIRDLIMVHFPDATDMRIDIKPITWSPPDGLTAYAMW